MFGVFGHPEAAKLTYLGLYALQHRGQESAGIASSDGARPARPQIPRPRAGNFHARGDRAAFPARRPSATRAIPPPATRPLLNAQPIVIDCNKGKLALGHNGNLTNALEMRRRLEHRGSIFQTTSDTEVIVHLIARSAARNLVRRAGRRAESGGRRVFAAAADARRNVRDPRSARLPPAGSGTHRRRVGGGSETCAFDLIDAEYVREVEPGEMVRISRSGIESIRFAPEKPHQYCIFEHVYFSRPG